MNFKPLIFQANWVKYNVSVGLAQLDMSVRLLSARPPVRARDPTPLPLGIASTDTIPFIYAKHKKIAESFDTLGYYNVCFIIFRVSFLSLLKPFEMKGADKLIQMMQFDFDKRALMQGSVPVIWQTLLYVINLRYIYAVLVAYSCLNFYWRKGDF